MEANFNIYEAFSLAFGNVRRPVVYKPTDGENKPPQLNFVGVEVISDENEVSRLSYLGTPIISSTTFLAKKYKKYNQGDLVELDMKEFELPSTTIVSFSRRKRISTTPVLGSSGTVKELYGFDDWQIDIQGICLNDPAHPQQIKAADQIKNLIEWEKLADSIEVEGLFFNNKEIFNLVILEANFPMVPGKPNWRPFSFRCVSDEPIELFK